MQISSLAPGAMPLSLQASLLFASEYRSAYLTWMRGRFDSVTLRGPDCIRQLALNRTVPYFSPQHAPTVAS